MGKSGEEVCIDQNNIIISINITIVLSFTIIMITFLCCNLYSDLDISDMDDSVEDPHYVQPRDTSESSDVGSDDDVHAGGSSF